MPLIEICKQKAITFNKFDNYLWKNNRRKSSRYVYDYGKKLINIGQNSEQMKTLEALENNSLVIEGLTAVLKTSKLSPVRERLLRLFHAQPKSQWKKDQGSDQSVININSSDYKIDDNDSPSPYFKSKYKHYSEHTTSTSRNL